MISKRQLTKWRKEALRRSFNMDTQEPVRTLQHFSDRILKLTQELLDQHMLRKEDK